MEPDSWRFSPPLGPPPDGGQNYGGDASSFKQQHRDTMEADLWQPPPPPSHGEDLRRDRAAFKYGQLCDQLRKWWGVGVLDCLTPELRRKTPFSLDLLKLITRLAGLTRNSAAQTQDLFKLQVQLRQEKQKSESSTEEWVTTRYEYKSKKGNRVEENRENTMGLMIEDVKAATEQVRQMSKTLSREAGDKFSGTKQARKDAKRRRGQETVMSAMKRLRELNDDGENQEVTEASHALVDSSLRGGPGLKKERRQAKKARRIANKQEGRANLPLDSLEFGTLPSRTPLRLTARG